jgi:CHAT domain-containing protein/tetratricopeptide (TPR) repeat protein
VLSDNLPQRIASIPTDARTVKPTLKLLIICLLLIVGFGSYNSIASFAFSSSNHLPRTSRKPALARISQPGATQNVLPVLRQGEAIRQEIRGGDVNAFSVPLILGQYARIVVERQKSDLFLAVFSPDGQQLIESGNPAGAQGSVSVSIMAEATGNYKLEVRPPDKWSAPGSYLVRIEEVRLPTQADRNRLEAEKTFAEARQQQLKETRDSRNAAIKKYEQALQLWQTVEDGYEEANTLHSLGKVYKSLGDLSNAEKYYKLALARRREIKDHEGEAYTLNDLAAAYRDLSDPQKALEFYEESLSIFRETGNRRGEASSLYNIGFVYALGNNMHKALDYYGQAVLIRRAEKDRHEEARTLDATGGAYDVLGDPQAAMESYKQAMEGWHDTGDSIHEANTTNNIGKIYDDLGEWQKALESYSHAIGIYQDLQNADISTSRKLASTLDNIGLLYAALGDSQRALTQLNNSLAIWQELKEPRGEGFTEACIGYTYFLLGNSKEALSHYEKALPLQLKANDPRIAQTYTIMGMVYTSRSEWQKALNYYQQALRIQQDAQSESRQGQAITLDKMGQVYTLTSDLKNALESYGQALRLWQAIKDRDGEAITLYNIAQAQRQRGDLTEAHQQIEAALKIIESMRTNVTSQQLRTSYFANKENYYELDIDLKMQLSKSSDPKEQVASAFEVNERARARNLLDILSEARVGLRENDSELQQNGDPKLVQLIDRKLAVQRKLNAKAKLEAGLLSRNYTKEQAAAIAREVDELTKEYDEAEAQIKIHSPRYASLAQPQPLSAKEIQKQLLDDKTLLLEYALGDERSYLWAVTPTSITSYELPKRADIEKVARRIKDILASCRKLPEERSTHYQARLAEAYAQYRPEAASLSRMLLKPVAAQLGNKRLIIVAEGELQYVPFGGLPAPTTAVSTARQAAMNSPDSSDASAPLILDHEVINLPSASVLALIRSETRQRQLAPKALAVLADPVFEKDDSRLQLISKGKTAEKPPQIPLHGDKRTVGQSQSKPEALSRALEDFDLLNDHLKLPRLYSSLQEATDIMAVAPPDGRLEAIDFKASRAMATDPVLAQYRIIHFATHGLLDDNHPELSGIVLSLFDEQGQPQEDGFLRLHDIYNLKLPVELVVLSACQTGLGKKVKGEGLIGLTRGFMYAGAARVVASLWNVNDVATAELMKRFYKAMFKDKMTPAAALKAAQVSMWQQPRWHNPYFWSGFILQGEWQ